MGRAAPLHPSEEQSKGGTKRLQAMAPTDPLPSHPGKELCLLQPKMELEHGALASPTVTPQNLPAQISGCDSEGSERSSACPKAPARESGAGCMSGPGSRYSPQPGAEAAGDGDGLVSTP